MISKVKYSNQLASMAETYVVDGVCVKSRTSVPGDVTKKEINEAKKKHSNIAIQIDDKIDFYCDEKFSESFEYYIKNYAIESVKRNYETGNIKLHIK